MGQIQNSEPTPNKVRGAFCGTEPFPAISGAQDLQQFAHEAKNPMDLSPIPTQDRPSLMHIVF
jgi:hypothetical protein